MRSKTPELAQLEVLCAVSSAGSLSRAATKLGLSQPTVSFHLKALEDAAGARLLDRRTGEATAAGRVMLGYANRILALRDEALASVSAEAEGRAGHLRIAASSVPGEQFLPELLKKFRAKHSRVTVSASISDSRRALAQLLTEEVDIALIGSKPRDSRLEVRAFAEDSVVAVASPGRAPFADLPLIQREEGSGTRDAIEAVVTRRAELEVGSSEAAKRCAIAGLGVTLISRRAVAAELRAGTLRLVRVSGLPKRRTFYAARAGEPSGVAAAFWRLL